MNTIHIQNGSQGNIIESKKQETTLQYVPWKIAADCKADVTSYFNSSVKTSEDGCSRYASFRGHPLVGKAICIPDGYRGIILNEQITPVTEMAERNLYIVQNFKCFLYWKSPTENDTLMQGLSDWIDIAEALHRPTTLQ